MAGVLSIKWAHSPDIRKLILLSNIYADLIPAVATSEKVLMSGSSRI
jgi:hypothetical protein